jgi:hypothetical protein
LKIGPLIFEIVEYSSKEEYTKLIGEDTGLGMFGVCQTYPKTRILLNSLQDDQSKQLTLLHEVLEALNFLYHLNLKERDIKTLEAGLGQVLKDNPSFTKKFITC